MFSPNLKRHTMESEILHVLLADDDADDRLFFKEAMEEINTETRVSFVNDGSQLSYYLNQSDIRLPDILFIDINMPVKNGMECLKEIRTNDRFKDVFIVIYSTSGSDKDMKEAYENGANIYLKKASNFTELKSSLSVVLNSLMYPVG